MIIDMKAVNKTISVILIRGNTFSDKWYNKMWYVTRLQISKISSP